MLTHFHKDRSSLHDMFLVKNSAFNFHGRACVQFECKTNLRLENVYCVSRGQELQCVIILDLYSKERVNFRILHMGQHLSSCSVKRVYLVFLTQIGLHDQQTFSWYGSWVFHHCLDKAGFHLSRNWY